jgi:hypothetical protein
MTLRTLGVLLLAACASVSFAKAQDSASLKIAGYVGDDKNKPLKGVSVSVTGDQGAAPSVTVNNGTFILPLAPTVKAGDVVTVQFVQQGYEPLSAQVTASSGPITLPFTMHKIGAPQPTKPATQPPSAQPLPNTGPPPSWLTDTQKNAITQVLKEREKDKGVVRLVCIGDQPQYADQIFEVFMAAGWTVERLSIGMMSIAGIPSMNEPLYILSPKPDSPTVAAVVAALGNGRISAPMHTELATLGPGSMGLPAVTIVIQKR